MKKHVAYFDKLIQQKLESLPRAIEGGVPIERLKEICLQLRILKDARGYFLFISGVAVPKGTLCGCGSKLYKEENGFEYCTNNLCRCK